VSVTAYFPGLSLKYMSVTVDFTEVYQRHNYS